MSYQPRPYQSECLRAVVDKFRTHNSCLVDMATGLGKTVIFSHLARDWPARVLVVAHRDELVSQAAEKMREITGTAPAVEMGERRSDERGWLSRARVVLTSVQTMCRPGRHQRFNPADFGLVIVDEAHHAVAATYRKVLAHFRQNQALKVLGVTATPLRADELALGQVFEAVAYRYGIEDAVSDGWLVPVRQQVVTVAGLDFSKVRTVAADLNAADLEAILTEEGPLHKMAAPTVEMAGEQPTLVFCVSVRHARLMAEILGRYKARSAAFLCGESPPEERRDTVRRFKEGRLQFLCNCGLFLEGFDAPQTANVVMGRPTASTALYVQVLGRGTRPLPGTVDGLATAEWRRQAVAASAKPHMTVLDFVGNAGRHRIIQAADVLGGKWGAPVRDYAKKTLAAEGDKAAVPIDQACERAKEELEFLADQERRRAVKAAAAEYRAHEVSPFASGGAPAVAAHDAARGDPASEKQIRYLRHLGVPPDVSRRYSKRQAGAVISRLAGTRQEARA